MWCRRNYSSDSSPDPSRAAKKDVQLESIAMGTLPSPAQLPTPTVQARTDNLRRVISTDSIVPTKPTLPTNDIDVDEQAIADESPKHAEEHEENAETELSADGSSKLPSTPYGSSLPQEETAADQQEDELPPAPRMAEDDDEEDGANVSHHEGAGKAGDLSTEVVIEVNAEPRMVAAAADFDLLSSTAGGGYLTLDGNGDTDSGSDAEEAADAYATASPGALPAEDTGATAGGGYLAIDRASDGSGSDEDEEELLQGNQRSRNSVMASMAASLGSSNPGKDRPESTLSANFDLDSMNVSKTPSSMMAGTISLGARVSVEGYSCEGTVRFIGPHHDASKGARVLVELDLPVGKNNGTVGGHVYGAVAPDCGVLVVPSKVYKGIPGRRVTKREKPGKNKGGRRSTKRQKKPTKSTGNVADEEFDEDIFDDDDGEFEIAAAALEQAPARSRASHLLSMSRHLKGGSMLESEMDVDDDIDLDNIDLESPVREQYNGFASTSPDFGNSPSVGGDGEYGFGGGINFVEGVSEAGPVEEEFGFETDGDPRLHAWYVDDMDEDAVTKLVLAASTGDFLVRTTPNTHILHINDHQRIKQVTIKKTGRGTECELNGKLFADVGNALDSLQRDPLLSVRGMPLNLASPASNSA